MVLCVSGNGAKGEGKSEVLQGFHDWTPNEQQSVLRREPL